LEDTYKIVRFHKDKDQEIIETGLTLAEAKEHCNDPDTEGDDWFDGFTKED
jgi:hypothetical protein